MTGALGLGSVKNRENKKKRKKQSLEDQQWERNNTELEKKKKYRGQHCRIVSLPPTSRFLIYLLMRFLSKREGERERSVTERKNEKLAKGTQFTQAAVKW